MLTLSNWDKTPQLTFYVLDPHNFAVEVSLALLPGQSGGMTVILHGTYDNKVGHSGLSQINQAAAIELGLSMFTHDLVLIVDSSSLSRSDEHRGATV